MILCPLGTVKKYVKIYLYLKKIKSKKIGKIEIFKSYIYLKKKKKKLIK